VHSATVTPCRVKVFALKSHLAFWAVIQSNPSMNSSMSSATRRSAFRGTPLIENLIVTYPIC